MTWSDVHFPDSAWLRFSPETLDALSAYKAQARAADLGRHLAGAAGHRGAARPRGPGRAAPARRRPGGSRAGEAAVTDADMSLDAVRRMADAVLYEGYILYPYRASAAEEPQPVAVRRGHGAPVRRGRSLRAQLHPDRVRAGARRAARSPGRPAVPAGSAAQHRSSAARRAAAWDEAVEREIEFTAGPDELLGPGLVREFCVPGGEDREALPGPSTGQAVRRRFPLAGAVSVRTTPVRGPVAGGPAAGPGGEPDRGRARAASAGTRRCRPRWSPRT